MTKRGEQMIRRLTKPPYPMDLLLVADPSEEQVNSYIDDGALYVATKNETIIGVYVLLQQNEHTMELMNIAVATAYQNRGIGKQLLQHAIQTAKQSGVKQLVVGTGNSSINQIAFYQKVGFRMQTIIHDYFVAHYDEPIFENGIQCRDRIELVMIF